jgi:hypothetical protein
MRLRSLGYPSAGQMGCLVRAARAPLVMQERSKNETKGRCSAAKRRGTRTFCTPGGVGTRGVSRLFVALVMPLPVDVVVRPNLPTLPIPPLSVGAQPYLAGTPLQLSLGLRMLAGDRSPPRSPWSGPENLPWLINASQPTRVPICSLDSRDYFRALKVGHVKVLRE